MLAAGATAAGALALGLLAGYELYDRLMRGSIVALIVLLIVFAAVGAYAGWLLGVVVYAGVRGQPEGES